MARLMPFKGQSSINDSLGIGDTLIATVPMFLYLFGHRFFTRGPVTGIER